MSRRAEIEPAAHRLSRAPAATTRRLEMSRAMDKKKPNTQGRKTVPQRQRMMEGKLGLPRRDASGNIAGPEQRDARPLAGSGRRSEHAVSRGGVNQESRTTSPRRAASEA